MSNEIGSMKASLSANSARFESDMQKAKEAVRKNAKGMEAAMQGVMKKFNGTIAAIQRFGATAALAAATGVALFIKKQIDIADEMGKLAMKTGTTSEFLSSMGLVASQTGNSLEEIAKGIQRLSMNMNDARAGTGEAKDAFADLGIAVTDNSGVLRNAQDVFLDVAARFKKMRDGADKTALAMKLLGKAGAELIPTLNEGRDGIEEFQRKAGEMGQVISTETALQAAYLNDQLDLLKQAAIGTGRSFALDLVPWLVDAVKVIKTAKEDSGTLMAAWVALGAVGHAVFGKSLQNEIDETRKRLEELTAFQERLSTLPDWRKKVGIFLAGYDPSKKIAEVEKELADLENQQKAESKAQQDRMKASLDAARKEAEERRKFTEEIRKQAEARMKAEQLSKEAEAAEKARIRQAEAAQKAIEDQVAALEFEAATYGKTTSEITLYRLELAGANAEQLKAAQLALDDIEFKEEQAAAFKEAEDKLAQLGARAQSFYAATRTPAERYNETIRELDELLNVGAIDMDLFSRASQQAWEDMEKATEKTKEKTEGFTDDLKDAFSGWANNMSSTLNDVLWNADSTFGDIATSFGKMITQMLIQTQLIKPMMEGLFGGENGGGGWFGSIFGGGGNESNLSGMGGVNIGSLLGGLMASIFHGGGRAGFDAVPARLVDPGIFARAPRLHEGLLPDEYPAILQKGETVLTPKQMEGRGGITIKQYITTPDISSFNASKGQIAADAFRAIRRGQRNL